MPLRKAAERDGAVLSEDDLASTDTHPVPRKSVKSTASAKTGTKRKVPAKQSRHVLADRTNVQSNDEIDEIEKPKAKRTKTLETKQRPAEVEESLLKENAIQETQQPVDERRSNESTKALPAREHTPAYTARAGSARPAYVLDRARSTSIQPGYTTRDRSASASGTERGRRVGDVETRRQLTAMTRECENLNLKNQALEDLVRDKAESNFDRLKREADLKTKQADELIASLKKELATLRKSWTSTASETGSLQEQLSQVSDAYEASQQENATLNQELTAARQSLQAVENERKSLEAKLVAARQQLTSDSEPKSSSRSIGVKSTEAQREAKMKESLYTDLTGLIIRGVKQKDGEDEYDCIQTGRNGTLHFHLSVMNENASTSNPKTPGLSYEDAEFSYEPFLDESRDKDLLEILPDYLSEDICFTRNHAVKFYSKVVESMTKKIVIEDD
ncbi:hypothetical protein AMS68_006224 [Peltaster fructicola]|uniref:Monopolin complex subunit Csm1/Pcs1 C-terminal domain-containing protein n=1 Tax=Peltaster fructicola TaxID=286661 RepID=A0A6H0Y120_9PEZI|nr:hypothetical protein AMS68_006224 [Peltaster fructicola]